MWSRSRSQSPNGSTTNSIGRMSGGSSADRRHQASVRGKQKESSYQQNFEQRQKGGGGSGAEGGKKRRDQRREQRRGQRRVEDKEREIGVSSPQQQEQEDDLRGENGGDVWDSASDADSTTASRQQRQDDSRRKRDVAEADEVESKARRAPPMRSTGDRPDDSVIATKKTNRQRIGKKRDLVRASNASLSSNSPSQLDLTKPAASSPSTNPRTETDPKANNMQGDKGKEQDSSQPLPAKGVAPVSKSPSKNTKAVLSPSSGSALSTLDDVARIRNEALKDVQILDKEIQILGGGRK
ncbi:hypothetical protein HK102_000916 [Quaeritorhiza haematococci]|nr:hypothetical protein HK102_000916 [Quaeritorhiza haematococci]